MGDRGFYIGELARLAGVSPKTIRYYEERGLLSRPRRNEAGYRIYSGAALTRLEFIRKAKGIGLTLSEIKDILDIVERGETPCSHTLQLINHKLMELEKRIQGLIVLRDRLEGIRKRGTARQGHCASSPSICPLIEEETGLS